MSSLEHVSCSGMTLLHVVSDTVLRFISLVLFYDFVECKKTESNCSSFELLRTKVKF
jgi:hypothetical protein